MACNPLTADATWRLLGLTTPMITVSFVLIGWLLQHVWLQSQAVHQERERQLLDLGTDTRITGMHPGLILSFMIGVTFLLATSLLALTVGLSCTELSGVDWLEPALYLFLLISGVPALVSVIILVALVILYRDSLIWLIRRVRGVNLILLEPSTTEPIVLDSRFRPNERAIRVWRNGLALTRAKERDWLLGSGFLMQPRNRQALRAMVGRAIATNQDVLSATTFDDSDYDLIAASVMSSIDDALARTGTHLARLVQPLTELTKAAQFLYLDRKDPGS
jgi:hypothetical protein